MANNMTRKIDPEIQKLLSKANVHRIGRGIKFTKGKSTGEEAWIVSVSQKLPIAELAKEELIPTMFRGLPTDVVVRKRADARFPRTAKAAKSRTENWRPAPGGVSIGHYAITAGTLGCAIYIDGILYILSNNHVLANCNEAEVGNVILQPGDYDGGSIVDRIGVLADFVPIVYWNGGGNGNGEPPPCPWADSYTRFGNFLARLFRSRRRVFTQYENVANLVDCAIARPDLDENVSIEILEIGTVDGWADPELGMPIRKSGRTTGLTHDAVREVDVTVNVNMGDGRIAVFTDCFATDDMCDPGDSGSLGIDEQNRAVGLLFAGSDVDTIFCKYSNVMEAFGLMREVP